MRRWWGKLFSSASLSPAPLNTGALGCGGQKIHKEWRRDISDTAAAGVTAPWLGRPPPPPGEIRGKKTRRKKVDASDTGGTRERRVNALTFGAQRKKTRKNPFIQSTKWPQVGS